MKPRYWCPLCCAQTASCSLPHDEGWRQLSVHTYAHMLSGSPSAQPDLLEKTIKPQGEAQQSWHPPCSTSSCSNRPDMHFSIILTVSITRRFQKRMPIKRCSTREEPSQTTHHTHNTANSLITPPTALVQASRSQMIQSHMSCCRSAAELGRKWP